MSRLDLFKRLPSTALVAAAIALGSAGAEAAYVAPPQAAAVSSFASTARELADALPLNREERSFASESDGAAQAEVAAQELTVAAPPIPEPETYALMLAGLGALGWLKRRRLAAGKAGR